MAAAAENEQGPGGGTTNGVDDRRILILYGSESGNSEDLAADLEDMTERLHFRTDVLEMNDVGLRVLTEYPFVILVLSTTGQGEIPKNAKVFWKRLLSRKLPPSIFKNVRFTTFGLGDSSYVKYNWAARKLHKRLEQLGAAEFYPRGEADERHDDGIDGTFLPWSVSLRSHLLSEYPLPEGLSPISPDLPLPPKIILERDSVIAKMREELGAAVLDSKAAQFSHVDAVDAARDEAALRIEREQPYHNIRFSRLSERTALEIRGGIDYLDRPNVLKDHPEKYSITDPKPLPSSLPPEDLLPIPDHWTATVDKNERLTPMDHWQDVRHLVLRLHPRVVMQQSQRPGNAKQPTFDSLMYEAGDALSLYPKNFPGDVQQLIDLMEWNSIADEPFKHYSERKDGIAFEHAPRRCYPVTNSTLRQLLTNNYDITAIPKRIFFDHAKYFAKDLMHKERLAEFADPRFTDEFYDYTSRPRRSILEVLQEFSSVKIPYQYVPLMFPPIRAREYSIASHGALMLDEDNPQDTLVELVIAVVKYKTVLRKTRRGLCSRYIESLQPGTKINVTHAEHSVPPSDGPAVRRPFIAVGAGTGVAPIRAFFHDRATTADRGPQALFFGARNRHADFFFEEEWPQLGVKIYPAFSRDQREKVYVQDVIRREYQVVCNFVQRRAIICICGSAGKMPVAVREAFLDAMIKGGLATDHQTAAKFIAENCTLWEETW